MGSKKHKKHKSERNDKYEEFSMDRKSSLKLILKVGGSNSTPEHTSESPAYGYSSEMGGFFTTDEYPEKHKKSKKKKKKKDREKKHKHHKEKRHRHKEDSSQEEMSFGEDNSCQNLQEAILNYAAITTDHSQACRPLTKPMRPRKPEEIINSPLGSPMKSLSEPPISLFGIANSPGNASTPGTTSTMSSVSIGITSKSIVEGPKTPGSSSESGREPRSCVLKLKQSKSPLTKLLDHLLRTLEKRDPHQFFAWPVTDDIAPGYSSIITKPMDFSTMRQKIEDNEYCTVQEFCEDFNLMCENAIHYNHVETVYHKAAKRLLHVGGKILTPENIIRSLKALPGHLRELSPKELGFELPDESNQDSQMLDSADEGASTGAEEPSQLQTEDEEKNKMGENDPKTKFEPYPDDLTPEEILAQVQNAASKARKRLTAHDKARRLGFLRQHKDGTTSLNILIEEEKDTPEKVMTIGEFVGKLAQGTGQLQGFREDRRNIAKLVKPLNYGAFSSFAPIFDSRFSNLNKEETELVLNTYADDLGVEYAESLLEFTKDSVYASSLANGLLDVLTNGEHSKMMSTLYESQYQRYEQEEIESSFPPSKDSDEDEYQKYKNTRIDFTKLRSLTELGIDVSFLSEMEKDMEAFEVQKRLHDHLQANLTLIEKLHSVQHERLSQSLPNHLSHISLPGPEEHQLACQITAGLTEMVRKVTPGAIANPHGLRKAMGLSNVGLPPPPSPKLLVPPILQEPCSNLLSRPSDTNQVDMDIDTDDSHLNTNNSSVDLENELREFLENGNSLTETDNSIEQILLN